PVPSPTPTMAGTGPPKQGGRTRVHLLGVNVEALLRPLCPRPFQCSSGRVKTQIPPPPPPRGRPTPGRRSEAGKERLRLLGRVHPVASKKGEVWLRPCKTVLGRFFFPSGRVQTWALLLP
ncbi:hypothetical protein IscW_ISCW009473, partial [Ixodes scapularis]